MIFWLPRSAKRGVSWGTGVDSGGVETVEYEDGPGFFGAGESFCACLLKVEYCLFLVLEGIDLTCFCVCIFDCSRSRRDGMTKAQRLRDTGTSRWGKARCR